MTVIGPYIVSFSMFDIPQFIKNHLLSASIRNWSRPIPFMHVLQDSIGRISLCAHTPAAPPAGDQLCCRQAEQIRFIPIETGSDNRAVRAPLDHRLHTRRPARLSLMRWQPQRDTAGVWGLTISSKTHFRMVARQICIIIIIIGLSTINRSFILRGQRFVSLGKEESSVIMCMF